MDPATLRDPRLIAGLAARLDGSNEPDTLLARDLARYYGLLARELATVQLTHEETTVLGDAVHAAERARISGTPFSSLAEAVASEFRRTQGLADRRTVDGDELAARVAAWTRGQTLAVVDAFERLRALIHRGRLERPADDVAGGGAAAGWSERRGASAPGSQSATARNPQLYSARQAC